MKLSSFTNGNFNILNLFPLIISDIKNYSILAGRVILAIVLSGYILSSFAASVEERLDGLERMLLDKGFANISSQMQQLKDEIKALQIKLEDLNYTLEALSNRQADGADGSEAVSQVTENSPPNAKKPDVATTVAPQSESDDVPLIPHPVADKPTEEVAINQPQLLVPQDDPSVKEAYQLALDQLKAGKSNDAIKAFSSFIDTYPESRYAGNAQYWLGEAYYVVRNFDKASSAFNQLLEIYPDSNKVAASMLKLGFIYQERRQIDQAMAMFEQVIQKFPSSREAKLAQKRKDSSL